MNARATPAPASGKAEITIFASGSEVEIALDAREKLEKKGRKTRVVSVPSFELFFQQDTTYRKKTIGDAPVRVAVEAAIRQGWDEFIGSDGLFVGMTGFGASGKIEDLYPHFGITADHVAKAAEGALAKKS